MGGIPNPSIASLWNKANIILETGWSEKQYYQASRRITQALVALINARVNKQKQENQRQNNG